MSNQNEKIKLRASKYAMVAVSISIVLTLFGVFVIRLTTNPNVVEMLVNQFQGFTFSILAGILSLFLSAFYFGKKAGLDLGRDIRFGSSIGLTTALKVLASSALTVSLAAVIQMNLYGGFHLLLSFFSC